MKAPKPEAPSPTQMTAKDLEYVDKTLDRLEQRRNHIPRAYHGNLASAHATVIELRKRMQAGTLLGEATPRATTTPDEVCELYDIASQVWTIKIAVDAGEDSEQVWAALNQVERSLRRLCDRVGELLTRAVPSRKEVA